MTYTYLSKSYQETEEIGRAMAKLLKKGSSVALNGDLGAGKTAFIRGLARGLGYAGRVTSPSFSLVNEYLSETGEPLLYHFDLYRIKAGDLADIGWYDYLESGVICAVEWADIAEGELPEDTVFIKITTLGEDNREITVSGLDKITFEG